MKLFFVIPVLNECDTVATLLEGIRTHAKDHNITVLFVNDGSTDGTGEILDELALAPDVSVIHFRRNFGKSQALAVAFSRAEGDVVITMDGDLQDDPAELPKLLAKIEEGYDVVCGWKENRRDPIHKTLPSRIYNGWMRRMFEVDLHDINTGFKAMRLAVVQHLHLYGEMHRMIAVFAASLGYKVTEVPVTHHPRRFGHSKFGFERFYRGGFDAITVQFLNRYQYNPSHFFGPQGLLLALAGMLLLVGGLLGGVLTNGLIYGLIAVAVGCVFMVGGIAMMGFALLAELIVRKSPPVNAHQFIREERDTPDPSHKSTE